MPKIFESEYRFMLIVWERAPVSGAELVRLAAERLGWKKSTVYTVIRRLGERGILENRGGTIYPLVSRADAQREEGRELLERSFGGSLPGFIAAFASSKSLTHEEAEEIRRIIDQYEEGLK